jgi:hypothetical protein
MRVFGRILLGRDPETGVDIKQWVEVDTDPNGDNDHVYLTALAQALLLNFGESPFYANWGIPAVNSVLTQTFPDVYVTKTQQGFAGCFAALAVVRLDVPTPTYDITVRTHAGVVLNRQVPIPT